MDGPGKWGSFSSLSPYSLEKLQEAPMPPTFQSFVYELGS